MPSQSVHSAHFHSGDRIPPAGQRLARLVALVLLLASGPARAEPVTIESLGLSLDLPAEAQVRSTRIAGASVARILAPDATWSLEIAARSSTDQAIETRRIAQDSLDALLAANSITDGAGQPIGTLATPLSEIEPFEASGAGGHRFLLKMPSPSSGPDIIRGAAILATGPGTFLVFDLTSSEPHLDQATRAFDVALSSLDLQRGQRAQAERALAVQSALRLMSSWSEQDLIDAVEAAPTRFERLYIPAPTGAMTDATELGYRKITAWKGSRGELNPKKSRASWSATDKQPGLLVRLDSRSLVHARSSAEAPDVIDLRSLFFVSLDREVEAWQTTMAIKPARGAPERWTQIGARVGDSMNVTSQSASSAPQNTSPALLGEGYLPIVHTFLIPRLLAKAAVPGTYGFYTFRASDESISLRRDTLKRDDALPDGWVLETRLAPGLPVERSLLRSDGSLIRQVGESGRIWEPIRPEELTRIWESKGLPVD